MRRLCRLAALGWALVTLGPVAVGAARRPDPVYRVSLDARLGEGGRIDGVERLIWRNTSGAPVGDLWFHLYLNAFANERTTFMRESGGQLRSATMPDDRWGWIEVESATLSDGTALRGEVLAPDDGNPDDRTVIRYALPAPLPAGAEIEVELAFTAQLPGVFARSGIHGDYVFAGQWFPKIAVLEAAGVRGRAEPGWSCHQYHANSEFYADFGDYDVTLTLPARYAGRVGGCGRLVDEVVEGDDVRVRFAAEGVHDFSWTADPRFVVVADRFEPAVDVDPAERASVAALLGLDETALALEAVDIRLLLSPANRAQADRYLAAAHRALAGYGLRLGAYPWGVLTLVDPPRGALGSGGMEYQTLVTLATHPALDLPGLTGILIPELVTIHEIGHNWWQGMVANDEFEEAWLDEGINSYYELLVMEQSGEPQMALAGLELSPYESQRLSIAGGRFTDPVVRESWRYSSSGSYSQTSYGRAAVTMRHLERLIGEQVFARAMRAFFEQARFTHPTTADFERTMATASGRDLDWFFAQALHSSAELDLAVRSARCRRVKAERGVFWRDGKRVEIEAADQDDQDGDEPAPGGYESIIVLERRGEFRHPTEVELRWADGTTERRPWDGQERWTRWRIPTAARLTAVVIDPDEALALDVDRINNSYRLEPDPAPVRLLLARVMAIVQVALATALGAV